MKLRWLGALSATLAPLACSLAIDTDGFAGNGAGDGGSGGGSSGNTLNGPSGTSSGSSGSTSSGSPVDGSSSSSSGDARPLPGPRFCSTVKPSMALLFCEDFDDDGRTDLLANGWTLIGGGTGQKVGLSLETEPAASYPRAARIVQDSAAELGRTRIARNVTQTDDFRIHFKFYRDSVTGNPALMSLQGTNCGVVVSTSEIVTYCPEYKVVTALPVMPEKTWNDVTILIEKHDLESRFFITTPGMTNKEIDHPEVKFTALELGQGTNDHTQVVYFDDVWAEIKD